MASNCRILRQLATFGAIGLASTAAYVVLYAGLRELAPAALANAAALLVTAVANTAANRRMTFAVRGRRSMARDHAAGVVALGAALAFTSVSLAIVGAVAPNHGRLAEIGVLVIANAAATVVRFLLLRMAIDRPRDGRAPAPYQLPLTTLSTVERTRP